MAAYPQALRTRTVVAEHYALGDVRALLVAAYPKALHTVVAEHYALGDVRALLVVGHGNRMMPRGHSTALPCDQIVARQTQNRSSGKQPAFWGRLRQSTDSSLADQ